MTTDALPSMLQAAVDAGLAISEIIKEPDGRLRLLTKSQAAPVIMDELEAKRAERNAAKGKRDASSL